jgi:hypothetical protein
MSSDSSTPNESKRKRCLPRASSNLSARTASGQRFWRCFWPRPVDRPSPHASSPAKPVGRSAARRHHRHRHGHLTLAKQLPGHKVLIGAAIVAIVGGTAHAVGLPRAIPFGPFAYADSVGPILFGNLAWPMPALWIIASLTPGASRDSA